MSGKKRTVDGENLMGEEAQKINNFNQDLEDLLVALFSQPVFEVGEGCFTRDIGIANPREESIVPTLFFVPQGLQEGFHIGELFKVAKELQEKETDRVIGNTGTTISISHQGADEREVNQGGSKAGEAANYTAALFDPDIAMLEGILGKPEDLRFWKGSEVVLVNADTDAVEFAHDLA
jgi:hypothetical protein